jgi:hypothetical protein
MSQGSVICPGCEYRFRVPDRLLGKRVRCPLCTAGFVADPDDEAPPEPAKTALCPQCGLKTRLPGGEAGRNVFCAGCGHEFAEPEEPSSDEPDAEGAKRAEQLTFRLGLAAVASGLSALLAAGVPFLGLMLGGIGAGLAGASLYRSGSQNRRLLRLGVVGGAVSLGGFLFGIAAIRSWVVADTPEAIAAHAWWQARVTPEDVERVAVKICAMNAADAFFVDRAFRAAVRTRVPETGMYQGRLNDAYRPLGIGTPYLCIYFNPAPSFQHPTREEALHLLRQKLDRAEKDAAR